ncbi:TonB-dependent receptor plug domain-containing protein [Thalassotalea ganghwensis]
MVTIKRSIINKKLYWLLFGLSFNFSAIAGDDIFELSLEQLMQTPVTIATVSESSVLKSPASVSLISKDDLNALGISTLIELFDYIPGFYSAYNSVEGNDSYMVSRGHAQKYANTILFLVNGQRINEDYTGGINYLIRNLKLSHVKRIEVIRGPGSSLYGANAFNGVVNIITEVTSSISASIGNLDSYRGSFGWQTHLNDWNIGLSFETEQEKGDTFNSVFDRFALAQQTSDPRKSHQAMLMANYQNFHWLTLYNDYQFEQFYLFRRLNNDVNRLQLNNLLHQASYVENFSSGQKLHLKGQWRTGKRRSLAMLQPQNDDIFNYAPLLFGENFSFENKQLNVDYIYPLNSDFEISSGAQWSLSELPDGAIKSNYNLYGDLEYLNDVTVFGEKEQRIVLDVKRKTLSAYAQLKAHLSPQLTVTSGVRYDSYNDIENRVNPRLALVYETLGNGIIKLSYNEAYRVPSLGDLYDEENGLVDGNQTLKPTVLKSAELNYQLANDNLFFSSTLFSNHISDLIGFDTSGTVSKLANISSNKAVGIETEWRWTLNNNWQLFGHFTQLLSNRSKAESPGERIPSELIPSELLSPKKYGLLGVKWQYNNSLSGDVQFHWRSKIATLSNHSSLLTTNMNIRHQVDSENEVKLKVANLFDKQYAHPTITTIGNADNMPLRELPARGQHWVIEYTYHF